MKGFLQGQSKGKKAVKLRKLGSSIVITTTTCTTTSTITTATVLPPVALQAGMEPTLPEVPKELLLLFLEESEELLVSEDPQSDLEPVPAGQASHPPPTLVPRVISSLLPDQQHPWDTEFFPDQQPGAGSGSSFGQTWQRGHV